MPYNVISKTRVPIKAWLPLAEIEPQAIEQLERIANMPFIFKHVAVMPDVHLGKGATVGSVIASKDVIMPAAVGVDIGCGMRAVKTELDLAQMKDASKEIYEAILQRIPVGKNSRGSISSFAETWEGWYRFGNLPNVASREAVGRQIGTLGGGNHFIEMCEDTEGKVWIVLHSGSRNIGKRVADYFIDKAKGLMENYYIALVDKDLAYLPYIECGDYFSAVDWCQEYAQVNRELMMLLILAWLSHRFGEFAVTKTIDCHHNYIAKEHHFGENVWVTRKGAVRARKGDYGIIPGSMGAKSYIVEGLGELNSFQSCSHGAGRRMSRTQAAALFTSEDLARETENVMCRKDDGVVDEIPSAYKDIDQVMENQKDLVKVVAELKQFICVKG